MSYWDTRLDIHLGFINSYPNLMPCIFTRHLARKVTQHWVQVTVAICTLRFNSALTHQVIVFEHHSHIVLVELTSWELKKSMLRLERLGLHHSAHSLQKIGVVARCIVQPHRICGNSPAQLSCMRRRRRCHDGLQHTCDKCLGFMSV